MFGYCWTGSTEIATAPASAMMIDTTAAKIGRSMKNLENTTQVSGRLRADGDVDAPRLVVVGAPGHVHWRHEVDAIRIHAKLDQGIPDRERPLLGELDVGAALAAP